MQQWNYLKPKALDQMGDFKLKLVARSQSL